MQGIYRWRIREPFCGLSHLFGAMLSVAGLFVLVAVAQGRPWHLAAFTIYGVSMVVLYLASTLYHSLPVDPLRVEQLRTFDQVAIYMLIAGTYTPVCLLALRGHVGTTLLTAVWTVAVIGAAARIWWRGKPEWLTFSLYMLMGFASCTAIPPLVRALTPDGFNWLLAGGVFYCVGSVILATKRPRLWPGVFGSHDLWHVFVLAGSACHFIMMTQFVARH